MVEKGSVAKAMVASTTLLPQAAGMTLHWDGRSGVCRQVGSQTFAAPVQQPSFQAKAQPATEHRARSYWTTSEICLVPALSPQMIEWEHEAAFVTFDLAPVLLADTAHEGIPRASGELVWVRWQEKTESPTPAVHPALMMHATYESLQAERITIVPCLKADDPLLQHMALVLQAAVEGEGVAGHLYAESLADALVVHFLRRYVAARQSMKELTGGLSPYKLRCTTAYITAHLDQELSLATLAAISQTSPAHFARLFKHATGLPPHQYVITCRMEHAKQLLAETDVPLSEIGLQVGCADQSHFTALFRTHAFLTPKAFRDSTRR
jgi:AraC-like DNA-binding protein